MEACVTLGMLTADQARRLKEAGLTAYNHNLDTSRRYYPEIITTRTYDDRLETLRHVQRAGISVCCGGIVGMGETEDDRLMMLVELANLDTPPESVPINCLMPMQGTPLQMAPPVDSVELVRLIATARIAFPTARVRLSAGRDRMSRELQILCFLAGADSIFFGEKLLTAGNPGRRRRRRPVPFDGPAGPDSLSRMTLFDRWTSALDQLRSPGAVSAIRSAEWDRLHFERLSRLRRRCPTRPAATTCRDRARPRDSCAGITRSGTKSKRPWPPGTGPRPS